MALATETPIIVEILPLYEFPTRNIGLLCRVVISYTENYSFMSFAAYKSILARAFRSSK